jgi:serine/threonine protein kinase
MMKCVCAAPDYVAPEMLKGEGVNQACDWWALGVVIFEMMSSTPPFTAPDGADMQTFSNILKGELHFPAETDVAFSSSARDMLKSLLTVKVSARLGNLKGGAEDVQNHEWFAGKGFAWDALVNLIVVPPWKPTVSAADDTANFDENGKEECLQYEREESAMQLTDDEHQDFAHVWAAFPGDPSAQPLQLCLSSDGAQ